MAFNLLKEKMMNTFDKKFNDLAEFPISFNYDGKNFHGFGGESFRFLDETEGAEESKKTTVTRFLFKDILVVELVRVFYPKYDFYEWSVSFENKGSENSGVISNLSSEIALCCEEPILKGILGDNKNLYKPYEKDLASEPARFLGGTGRPTHVNFPYFNLTCRDGGAFIAIGWAGTWSANFQYADGAVNCSVRSTPRLKTYLKPGERIVSAIFLCGLYKGDYTYSVNHWRRWFIENNMPVFDKGGAPMRPFSTVCFANDTGRNENYGDSSASERHFTWKPSFEKMVEVGCKPDFRLIKGGWYDGSYRNEITRDWQHWVGTWEPARGKWPNDTMKETTDFARANDMKTALWFMPDTYYAPQKLVENFGYQMEWAVEFSGFPGVNDISQEGAYEWTKNKILKTMTDAGIEMYCEDLLRTPVFTWYHNDLMEDLNRIGIKEISVISAHYRLWDDIIEYTAEKGNVGFISMFSGAGRNDLQSLRRVVPMFRSDNDYTSIAQRLSITSSLTEWLPFSGSGIQEKENRTDAKGMLDTYTWRASYLPIINIDTQFAQDPDQDFSVLNNGMAEWKRVNPYLLKDFYSLTPWHSGEDKSGFTSYCYYDEDEGRGVLFVFRGEECEGDCVGLRLPFADQNASYALTDEDSGDLLTLTGNTAADGFGISVESKRQAKLIWIEKK